MSIGAIAEKYDIPECEGEEMLLDLNIELCSGCGWWHESFDLVDDEGDNDGYCLECRRDMQGGE